MSNTTMKSRWTSFIASPVRGRVSRGLEDETNPKHRARVELNKSTILIHLSDEDGAGWTVLAVDRKTRSWAVSQANTQMKAAKEAYEHLYRRLGT
jgi:hypothetical protein